MGTRGLFGFFYKGKYYVAYNHFDSYTSGLGVWVVTELEKAIKENKIEEWKQLVDNLKEVNCNVPPTEEEIEKLKEYANLGVSYQKYEDWYCLLHKCQGSLSKVLESGYIVNCVNKDGKPDWESYAYIVNLDQDVLEFYDGEDLDHVYTFNNLPDWKDPF